MANRRLILLGAGHAHLLLTERLDVLRDAGIDPLLIAPRWFDYSGLATGVLSGSLPPATNRIDVAGLARRRELAFVEGRVVAIDRANRTVTLADETQHRFDFLSLNIGSVVRPGISGNDVWPVKPLAELNALRAHIESQPEFPHVLIVGAGPSGTEIAAALLGLAERIGLAPRITLAGKTAGDGVAWRSLYASLERRGLKLIPRSAPLPDHDLLVAATGLWAPALVREAGLATSGNGGAEVAATLQSTIDPAIFAVGDCAEFRPRELPRQGVFGVRQAPVLIRNLAAAANGKPLEDYRPQRRWLSIMDLGNQTGFATWGPFAWRSRAMLRWKRRLDMLFLYRFR